MAKLSRNAIIGYPAGIITGITCELNPQIGPIRRHPVRLTAIVGHPFLITLITVIKMYRAAPPMKLPAPTMNMFLSISIGDVIYISNASARTVSLGFSHYMAQVLFPIDLAHLAITSFI